jgi:phosphatidylserine/phosphatidylglycerophosphate/cardiolipin synthase-like enzyme
MAEFLTTSGTAFHIENVITTAREELILISPFWRFSKTLYERLKDADDRRITTTIIFGKRELDEDQIDLLLALSNASILYSENLHAKCYFNESHMVITSMNIYEFSEKRNREMGVLLTKEADEDAFVKAVQEAKSIEASAEVLKSPEHREAWSAPTRRKVFRQEGTGYCIRCGTGILLDPGRPLCGSCFQTWSAFGNPNYPEQICHICGKAYQTSYARPICDRCY